jgi:ABC-type phosphate/phosphonate transport system substrate-binding protein
MHDSAHASRRIANARMYAVTPDVEQGWRGLLARVAEEAGVPLDYLAYPAPQPLEALWSRTDLGCVFMCGFPIAKRLAPVVPLAAPIPDVAWARGRAVYRTDLIVRADSPFRTLADTFGHRAGFTVAHSQSGFNAFRSHLLRQRSPARPRLYAQMLGDLVTARRVLDSVRAGEIDIGPLDAYWHALLALSDPASTAGIRVLESTPVTPMPALVTSVAMPHAEADRLRRTLLSAATRPWFQQYSQPLRLAGFEAVTTTTYEVLLESEREALAAGYPQPA